MASRGLLVVLVGSLLIPDNVYRIFLDMLLVGSLFQFHILLFELDGTLLLLLVVFVIRRGLFLHLSFFGSF